MKNKETLEEASKNFANKEIKNSDSYHDLHYGFIEGAKWQEQNSDKKYSEEDMANLWQFIVDGAKQLILSGTTNVGSFEDYIKSIKKQ